MGSFVTKSFVVQFFGAKSRLGAIFMALMAIAPSVSHAAKTNGVKLSKAGASAETTTVASTMTSSSPTTSVNEHLVSTGTSTASAQAVKKEAVLRSNDRIAFEMKYESYLNREKPPAGVSDYQQIGAHFRTESDNRNFNGTIELGGTFATAVENYSNVYVPEAFIQLQTSEFQEAELNGDVRARISLGRKLEVWSQLDRNWDLGLWEPLNRFDALRPIDQGLTGAFVEAGSGEFKFVAFVSPMFVPEQSGPFDVRGGKFVTRSPWFSEPTDRLILFSETTDVQYTLNTPSTGSVVGQVSGGLLMRYGGFQDGFYTQASYAFKPRNQLSTPFEGSLTLTDTTNFASVEINPKVNYHQLVGGEIGYNSVSRDGERTFGIGMSALMDAPINESPGANLTYQELDPLMLLSPRISFGYGLGLTDLELAVSYLQSSGGGSSMRGPFASEKAVFGARVPFREAVSVDGKVAVGRGRRTTFTLGGRWVEELAENGSLLMADANLDFSMNGETQDWRVSLVADVLGSRLPSNENQGYISRYRGNDRWMSQLRFIF